MVQVYVAAPHGMLPYHSCLSTPANTLRRPLPAGPGLCVRVAMLPCARRLSGRSRPPAAQPAARAPPRCRAVTGRRSGRSAADGWLLVARTAAAAPLASPSYAPDVDPSLLPSTSEPLAYEPYIPDQIPTRVGPSIIATGTLRPAAERYPAWMQYRRREDNYVFWQDKFMRCSLDIPCKPRCRLPSQLRFWGAECEMAGPLPSRPGSSFPDRARAPLDAVLHLLVHLAAGALHHDATCPAVHRSPGLTVTHVQAVRRAQNPRPVA
jgi:hypothetical protein